MVAATAVERHAKITCAESKGTEKRELVCYWYWTQRGSSLALIYDRRSPL